MKRLKVSSLVLLGFAAAAHAGAVARETAPAKARAKAPAAKSAAAPAAKAPAAVANNVYGPLPPPGFVAPKAAPAPAAQPAPAAKAPSRFAFLRAWIPSWLKKPAAPAPAPAKVVQAPSARPTAAHAAPQPAHAPTAPTARAPLAQPARVPAPQAPAARALPAQVKSVAKAPQAAPTAPRSATKSAVAKHQPRFQTSLPEAAKRSPSSAPLAHRGIAKYQMPVPTAPALPSQPNVAVPDLQLPPMTTITVNRDPLPPLKLGGRNRAQLHNYSRQARLMLLPAREYSTVRNSEAIVAKFAAELNPKPHRAIRTPYKLALEKHAKIRIPPAPIQYENMVKRIDALFDGLDLAYPKAIQSLWDLSELRTNAVPLQARDALFAGILSHRAGWEAISGNLMEASTQKGVDKEERYLRILFKELENFSAVSHIDRVIAKVNPVRAKLVSPEGDKANYAMGRRVLLGRAHPSLSAQDFEDRISGAEYRERLQLIRAVSQLRGKSGKEEAGLATLRRLESEGQESLRQEARLALARTLLQKGESHNALDLYRNVVKDGKNRLEVLAEQSYAEYRAGLYQESLGKAMGLQSPYFQYGFAPDIHLIEVLSRKSMCDFGGAESGLHRFVDRYGRELAGLQSALTAKANPKAFYEELISYHGKQEPMRFQRFLLRLAPVMENQKVLTGALQEFEKAGQVGVKKYAAPRPAGWDRFLAAMQSSWKRRGEVLKVESAKSALAEAEYMVKRLRHTFAQAELLGLDLATSASKNFNLQSALNFPVRKLAEVEMEKDKFHWPFEDEIWEDELDFLKMKNPSKCASAGARPSLE